MPKIKPSGSERHAKAAAGASISLTLIVPSQGTENDFIKAAVREARIRARQWWRDQSGYVLSKGGRPSLKRAVWEACDSQWKQWGGKFPRNGSSAEHLTRRVAELVPGKRTDLRRIKAHVDQWIRVSLTITEIPESWLKTAEGKKLVRLQFMLAIMGEMLACHPLTEKGPFPIAPAHIDMKKRYFTSLSDTELRRIIIASRNK